MTPLEIAAKAFWNKREGRIPWDELAMESQDAVVEDMRAAFLAFADAVPTEAMGNATVKKHWCGELIWNIDAAKAYIRAGANEKPTEEREKMTNNPKITISGPAEELAALGKLITVFAALDKPAQERAAAYLNALLADPKIQLVKIAVIEEGEKPTEGDGA